GRGGSDVLPPEGAPAGHSRASRRPRAGRQEPRVTTPDDPRPAPQYGEYATPEEQRARIRQPDPAAAPPPAAAVQPYAPHPPHARPTTDAARPTRAADRIITFALLAYGLITVVTAVPQMLDFAGFAQTWMA